MRPLRRKHFHQIGFILCDFSYGLVFAVEENRLRLLLLLPTGLSETLSNAHTHRVFPPGHSPPRVCHPKPLGTYFQALVGGFSHLFSLIKAPWGGILAITLRMKQQLLGILSHCPRSHWASEPRGEHLAFRPAADGSLRVFSGSLHPSSVSQCRPPPRGRDHAIVPGARPRPRLRRGSPGPSARGACLKRFPHVARCPACVTPGLAGAVTKGAGCPALHGRERGREEGSQLRQGAAGLFSPRATWEGASVRPGAEASGQGVPAARPRPQGLTLSVS